MHAPLSRSCVSAQNVRWLFIYPLCPFLRSSTRCHSLAAMGVDRGWIVYRLRLALSALPLPPAPLHPPLRSSSRYIIGNLRLWGSLRCSEAGLNLTEQVSNGFALGLAARSQPHSELSAPHRALALPQPFLTLALTLPLNSLTPSLPTGDRRLLRLRALVPGPVLLLLYVRHVWPCVL